MLAGLGVAAYGAEGGISILDNDVMKRMGIKTDDVKVEVDDPSSLEEWIQTEEYQKIVSKLIDDYLKEYNKQTDLLDEAYKKLAKLYKESKVTEDDVAGGVGVDSIYSFQRETGDCILVFLAKCMGFCGTVDAYERYLVMDFEQEFPNLCDLLEKNSVEITGQTIMNSHKVFTGLDQDALRAALEADEADGHVLSEFLAFNGLYLSYTSAILAVPEIQEYLDNFYGKVSASKAAEAKELVDYVGGWYKSVDKMADKLTDDIRDVQAKWVAEHTPTAARHGCSDPPIRFLRRGGGMGRGLRAGGVQEGAVAHQPPRPEVHPQPLRRMRPRVRLLLRPELHAFGSLHLEGGQGPDQHRGQAGQGAPRHGGRHRHRLLHGPLPVRRVQVPPHQALPGGPALPRQGGEHSHQVRPGHQGHTPAADDEMHRGVHHHRPGREDLQDGRARGAAAICQAGCHAPDGGRRDRHLCDDLPGDELAGGEGGGAC